jgi:hypothetical protein
VSALGPGGDGPPGPAVSALSNVPAPDGACLWAMNIAGVRSPGGRPVRRRDYPGWRTVCALAVTETISYGVLYYSFAAFLLRMRQSLG